MSKFSIINGAQTTSALGKFLTEAEINYDFTAIDNLKHVFVLTRILRVNDEELMSKIATYNNTQNPITTRDMVSNRPEQLKLSKRLSETAPHVYMEIRRGLMPPAALRFYQHQKTDNVELAQLAFSGFLRDPSTAKDKKTSLFEADPQHPEFIRNEFYHRIFSEQDGILYKKTNDEVDELLFVYYLYKKSKTYLNRIYKDRINAQKESMAADPSQANQDKCNKLILLNERHQTICRKCAFFCLSVYYAYKEAFFKKDIGLQYRFNDYYSDPVYSDKLIKAFAELFLQQTVSTIYNMSKDKVSLDDWFRGKRTDEFKAVIDEALLDITYEDKYASFVSDFKVKKV